MDKNYNKVYIIIFLIIASIISVFGVDKHIHRNELTNLLKVESEKGTFETKIPNASTNNNNISNLKIKKEYEEDTNSTSNNKDDINSELKIKNLSSHVVRKQQDGIDLITDIETITNQQEIDFGDEYSVLHNNIDNEQLLARLIQSEAGDEPYQGKLAVGNVVLYRTREDNTTIEGTIFKKGQFDGVNTNNFTIKPSEESIQAAKEVLSGKKVLNDGYYFVNLKMASPSWAGSSNFITRIGDHWFFRK